MRIVLVMILALTGCAGAKKSQIVACTSEKQWTSGDGKTGIHVCFTADGDLRYTTQALPPAAQKSEPKKRSQAKVEKEPASK